MSEPALSDPFEPDEFERRLPPVVPSSAPAPASREDALPGPPPADAGDPPAPPPAPGGRESVPRGPAAGAPTAAGAGPVPWKGAASSVPRLRQRPVSYEPAEPVDAFPGFAQDALAGRAAPSFGDGPEAATERAPAPARPLPLAVEPPFWELWLERVRSLPPAAVLGAAVGLAGVILFAAILRPHEKPTVSLAAILQDPERYDGQLVVVRGKAGETFHIGGNFVFDLRQGRDTIVVYSRTRPRPPALHENVKATGTVSIGYLDGLPRVAVLEQPPAR